MSAHGIMKETQTIQSAPYSLESMNTIKLQREELTPTAVFFHAFLFTFSSGKLLLIFYCC